jgi:hypothetical protein
MVVQNPGLPPAAAAVAGGPNGPALAAMVQAVEEDARSDHTVAAARDQPRPAPAQDSDSEDSDESGDDDEADDLPFSTGLLAYCVVERNTWKPVPDAVLPPSLRAHVGKDTALEKDAVYPNIRHNFALLDATLMFIAYWLCRLFNFDLIDFVFSKRTHPRLTGMANLLFQRFDPPNIKHEVLCARSAYSLYTLELDDIENLPGDTRSPSEKLDALLAEGINADFRVRRYDFSLLSVVERTGVIEVRSGTFPIRKLVDVFKYNPGVLTDQALEVSFQTHMLRVQTSSGINSREGESITSGCVAYPLRICAGMHLSKEYYSLGFRDPSQSCPKL